MSRDLQIPVQPPLNYSNPFRSRTHRNSRFWVPSPFLTVLLQPLTPPSSHQLVRIQPLPASVPQEIPNRNRLPAFLFRIYPPPSFHRCRHPRISHHSRIYPCPWPSRRILPGLGLRCKFQREESLGRRCCQRPNWKQ